MRTFWSTILGAVAVATVTMGAPAPQGGTLPRSGSRADVEQWKTSLSNWGRWGKDDQIGALNLITPAKRRQAAALVTEGFSVSLASDVDTSKSVDNQQPYEHTMLGIGSDRIAVAYHGIAHTHLDSLAHANYDGVFYNGYTPDKEAVARTGFITSAAR